MSRGSEQGDREFITFYKVLLLARILTLLVRYGPPQPRYLYSIIPEVDLQQEISEEWQNHFKASIPYKNCHTLIWTSIIVIYLSINLYQISF